jgi:fused signal recognition particle receptor
MGQTWAELLGDARPPQEAETERRGFSRPLRESLSKSRARADRAARGRRVRPGDDASWERLEEALIRPTSACRATAELVRRLEAAAGPDELDAALAEEIAALLGEPPRSTSPRAAVILVVGVNGTGKTTTIGKLAQKLREHGRA